MFPFCTSMSCLASCCCGDFAPLRLPPCSVGCGRWCSTAPCLSSFFCLPQCTITAVMFRNAGIRQHDTLWAHPSACGGPHDGTTSGSCERPGSSPPREAAAVAGWVVGALTVSMRASVYHSDAKPPLFFSQHAPFLTDHHSLWCTQQPLYRRYPFHKG